MLLADIDGGLLDFAEHLACIAVATVPVRMYLVVSDGYTSTLSARSQAVALPMPPSPPIKAMTFSWKYDILTTQ
jgi:hypothetical protein